MRSPRSLLVLTAVCLALPGAVRAADPDTDKYGPERGNWEFTLGANGANDNEFDAGAFSLATSLGFYLTDGFELGVRHDMTFFDADNTDSNFAATTRGFLDYNLRLGRIVPYLGVNAGGRYGDNGVDETGTAAPEWGIKFYALKKTFIVASMEYQWFFEDVNDADDEADEGQFVYGLGIGFNF